MLGFIATLAADSMPLSRAVGVSLAVTVAGEVVAAALEAVSVEEGLTGSPLVTSPDATELAEFVSDSPSFWI